ncbi:hypothetical protein Bint_0020 [Brachyspira intermedia PWS/A]|uniref:Uncharacterized protein n=1 Tax=Brachyspira intermedia (strain ATCC 51140 / PWS/A) TaxID=1045858 RepID=G0ENY2_BRAIP|nr:hypothetical protein [Brachyspira intermedia]AEM20656.1 hypothetical protein Bint_0020 [Brachyspira intermedia PWS/A]
MMFIQDEYDAINHYVNKLKENGLGELKIVDKEDYYVIYIFIKRDLNIRKIINKISYEVHNKFKIYKTIQCQYFYDWYKDIKDFEDLLKKENIRDITDSFIFNEINYNYKKIEIVKYKLLETNKFDNYIPNFDIYNDIENSNIMYINELGEINGATAA